MDLDGFFDTATLAFFKADADAVFPLDDRHEVVDVAVLPPGSGKLAALRAEIGFIGRMRDLIRRRNIVAISANDPYLSGLNAMMLSRLTGVPYVIEVLSDYDLSYRVAARRAMPSLPSRWFEKRVERLVLSRADAVYGDREYYRQYALRSGARRERVRGVRAVTDPFYYSARPERLIDAYHPTNGRPVLFYAGRLSGEKYVTDLIEVLGGVRQRGADALLLVAGEGPDKDAMRKRSAELGLADHIVFLGNLASQSLFDVMCGATVLLATHAGYALIEMGLSATPIIAYDYEWHPEIVRNEDTGLLVPYRDSEAMASSAYGLIQKPARGKLLGARAREFCLTQHASRDARADERRIFEEIFARASGLRSSREP
jgi:glycosyltransferase involved in cell wall biosynthesis